MGLVVAAIFAAAMSTLSSSLNSSAAAAVNDFYIPMTAGARSDTHYLAVSRVLTAAWGALQMAVAFVAITLSTRVVDEVLGIASFTNGVILGMFLLGTFTRASQGSAAVGVAAGVAVMLGVKLLTATSWQWYVLIGSLVTLGAGVLASAVSAHAAAPARRAMCARLRVAPAARRRRARIGAYPAAVIEVGSESGVTWRHATGRLTYDLTRGPRPTRRSSTWHH